MCSNLIETLMKESEMSQLIIRNIVRNILLETRGPLAFIPILKEWIKVAAKHGERDLSVRIKGPNGVLGSAETACLLVPKQERHRVFDNFTPELQEYVLKHWRSREYFSQMIRGVSIGIVRVYEKPNYAGMKSGSTNMTGGIDADGKIIGTMHGYLTARMESGYSWKPAYSQHLTSLLNSQGEIKRDQWEKMLLKELNKGGGSTMVHEFQHWFQESIYYTTNREKIPTDSGKTRETKKTKPNYRDLKKIQLMLAKEGLSGVDWNTTIKVRGATAYKLTDPIEFFGGDDRIKQSLLRKGRTVSLLELAFVDKSISDTEKLIKVILHDYLKMQKWIDDNDISKLANGVKSQRYFSFIQDVGDLLRDKNAYYTHSPSMKSLQSWSTIQILKSSDFYKNGELKPNKESSDPTDRNIQKAEWVIITRGRQRLPSKKPGISWYAMEKKRGTETSGNEWTDRWVEFDAVASEYMVAEVQSTLRNKKAVLVYLVKGDAKKFAKHLYQLTEAKLEARGFKHTRLKDVNRKHIESLAERITDRLVETVEENPYEDYYDLNPKNANKSNQMAILSPQRFDNWVRGRWEDAPYGTINYWKWIFAKASGENV